jgi:hypothetical protein
MPNLSDLFVVVGVALGALGGIALLIGMVVTALVGTDVAAGPRVETSPAESPRRAA